MTKIRDVVNLVLLVYTLFIAIVVIANVACNIITPHSDYIVLGGGAIVIVCIFLMETTFKESV